MAKSLDTERIVTVPVARKGGLLMIDLDEPVLQRSPSGGSAEEPAGEEGLKSRAHLIGTLCPFCDERQPNHVETCASCGKGVESDLQQQWSHLCYLRSRVSDWEELGVLARTAAARALTTTDSELLDLERRLGLRDHEAVPRPSSVETANSADETVVVPVAPPAGLSFEWRSLGTYLLAERTLNGLLGIGVFLILASALVIATFNPTQLPPAAHLAAVAATTLLFFGVGVLVQRRLRLSRASAAILAVAGGLVPLDVWVLGQPSLLDLDRTTTWLAASVAALGVSVAASPLHGRVFGTYMAVALLSTLLASQARLGIPSSWWGVSLAVAAVPLVLVGREMDRRAGKLEVPVALRARQPVYAIAAVAAAAALLWGGPSGAMALTFGFVSLASALAAHVLRWRPPAYVATYLVLACLAAGLNALGAGAKPWAWLILGIVGLVSAEVCLRRSGEARRPLIDSILGLDTWRTRFGSPLLGAAYLALLVSVITAFTGLIPVMFGGKGTERDLHLATAGVLLVVLAISSVARRSALPQYLLVLLVPLWCVLVLDRLAPGAGPLQAGAILVILASASAVLASQVERLGRAFIWPWWIAAFVLGVAGPAVLLFDRALANAAPRTTAFAAVTAVYALSLLLTRRPAWSYPFLLAGIATYFWGLGLIPSGGSISTAIALLVVPAAALLLGAVGLDHGWLSAGRRDSTESLLPRNAWAQPPAILGVLTLLVAVLGSAREAAPGASSALGAAVLLGGLGLWRRSTTALIISGLSGALAFEQGLFLTGVPLANHPPMWAGTELFTCLLLLGLGLRMPERARLLAVWATPVMVSIYVLTVAMSVAVYQPRSLAATLGLVGLAAASLGAARQDPRFASRSVGLVLLAGGVLARDAGITQPQMYALPAGFYLLGLAYLEWRRGTARNWWVALELSAVLVLVGSLTLQAVGLLGNPAQRLVFAMALIAEGLALLGVGATWRWRRTFFAGAAAVVVGVLALLAEPLRYLNTWYVLAGVGISLIGLVVLLERRRQQVQDWVTVRWKVLEMWE